MTAIPLSEQAHFEDFFSRFDPQKLWNEHIRAGLSLTAEIVHRASAEVFFNPRNFILIRDRMKPSDLGRLLVAIAVTLLAGPLAFFNGMYGVIGVQGTLQDHSYWTTYPGVCANLVWISLLFFSLGYTTCIVVAWKWYFRRRSANGAP